MHTGSRSETTWSSYVRPLYQHGACLYVQPWVKHYIIKFEELQQNLLKHALVMHKIKHILVLHWSKIHKNVQKKKKINKNNEESH